MTTDRINIDPTIMMGKPVIRGTRITVEMVLLKLAEGASEDELRDDYPHLTREDIRAAVALFEPEGRVMTAQDGAQRNPGLPSTSEPGVPRGR